MFKKLKKDFGFLFNAVRLTDRNAVVIFISVAVLQTVSWYYTSRRFFKINIYPEYFDNPDIDLYEFIYWFAGDTVALLLIPALIIIFYFKKNIRDFGFQKGDYKTGIFYTVIFLGFMIPILWFVSAAPEFAAKYPHLASARTDLNKFIIYEIGIFLYLVSWEFMWRGYMLFGLEEKFGNYTVLIQMIPFVILHNGKPALETFGAIFGGIALGILALRTRSVYYCILVHFGVMFSIDFLSRLRFNTEDYGIGINSLLNIISQLF